MSVKHLLLLGLSGATWLAGCSSSDAGLSSGGGSGGTSAGNAGATHANAGTSAGGSNTGGSSANAGTSASGTNTGGSSANAGTSATLGGSPGAGAGAGANAGGSAGQGGAAPGPVGPRFIGRFDVSDPTAPAFAWSGTAISLRFKGTAIGVTLTDGTSNLFEVIIDGKHTVVPSVGGMHKYVLGTGLTDGPHDLLLYRRTEAFEGVTVFNGFDIDPSAYLAGDPVPARRLEVIGDSISAGYGDEGMPGCGFTPQTENHYLTYEALAARSVGAELYTEAWSGIGMLRNYPNDTTNPRMPDHYPFTLPDKAGSNWDFTKFIPDAVLINLGTNDFSAGDPGVPFETVYIKFVTDLRAHYAAARIYLAVGPMLGGASYDADKAHLNQVIAARSSAGDKNLALLEFGTQDVNADSVGCDSHPSLATHQKMSVKLVAALKTDLGW